MSSAARRLATPFTCPARNGRRRRPSTQLERELGIPAICLFPCELFCRLQGARHQGADPGPWPAAGVARGGRSMTRAAYPGAALSFDRASCSAAAAQAESVADFYRGKTIELAIAGAPAGGYDVAARTMANHYGRHIPGNPTVIVKQHAGRRRVGGHQLSLQRRQARRHRDRHADQQRADRAAPEAASRPTAATSNSIWRTFPGSARRCRSRK